jgi:hypothetical protein
MLVAYSEWDLDLLTHLSRGEYTQKHLRIISRGGHDKPSRERTIIALTRVFPTSSNDPAVAASAEGAKNNGKRSRIGAVVGGK